MKGKNPDAVEVNGRFAIDFSRARISPTISRVYGNRFDGCILVLLPAQSEKQVLRKLPFRLFKMLLYLGQEPVMKLKPERSQLVFQSRGAYKAVQLNLLPLYV